MRYAVFLVRLCGLALVVIAGHARADSELPLFERRVGAWVLAAQTRADTGPFVQCILWRRTGEDAFLVFSLGRGGGASLRVAPWALSAGAHKPVAYQVDDNKVLNGQAREFNDGIFVPLARDTRLFDQLSAGKTLKIDLAGEVRQFDLAGLSSILPALPDCLQRFRDDAVKALAPPIPAATDEHAALQRAAAEAAGWARRITVDGAMPRVKLLSAEEMAQGQWDGFFKDTAAGWYSSKVIGGLVVHRLRHRSLEAAAHAWSVALRKQCDNDYTLSRRGRDNLVVGFHLDCRVGSQRERSAAVMFTDGRGFLWLTSFASAAAGPDDDIELVADDLRRAALARSAGQ